MRQRVRLLNLSSFTEPPRASIDEECLERRKNRPGWERFFQSPSFLEENRKLTLASLVILEADVAAVFMHFEGSGI
jgi:hypothetical protein